MLIIIDDSLIIFYLIIAFILFLYFITHGWNLLQSLFLSIFWIIGFILVVSFGIFDLLTGKGIHGRKMTFTKKEDEDKK